MRLLGRDGTDALLRALRTELALHRRLYDSRDPLSLVETRETRTDTQRPHGRAHAMQLHPARAATRTHTRARRWAHRRGLRPRHYDHSRRQSFARAASDALSRFRLSASAAAAAAGQSAHALSLSLSRSQSLSQSRRRSLSQARHGQQHAQGGSGGKGKDNSQSDECVLLIDTWLAKCIFRTMPDEQEGSEKSESGGGKG